MTQSFVCVGIDPVAGDVASNLRAADYRQVSDASEAQVVFVCATALEIAEGELLDGDGGGLGRVLAYADDEAVEGDGQAGLGRRGSGGLGGYAIN